jgi:hypothetical protein
MESWSTFARRVLIHKTETTKEVLRLPDLLVEGLSYAKGTGAAMANTSTQMRIRGVLASGLDLTRKTYLD